MGGLQFEKQRFIVVKRMICPIILGIDFWSRTSGLSFDFNKKVMTLNGGSEEVKLLHHPSVCSVTESKDDNVDPEETTKVKEVVIENEVNIPAR